MRGKKPKTIDFPPENLGILISKDGKAFAFDKNYSLFCINDNNNNKLPDAEALYELLKIGEANNRPKGLWFETTKSILENYRFYSWFRGNKLKIKEGVMEDIKTHYEASVSHPIKLTVYDGEDVRDLLELYVKSKSIPHQIQKFVNKSDNEVFSYYITDIIEQTVDFFRDSSSAELCEAGNMIYTRYIDPQYEGKTIQFYMELSGKGRSNYFESMSKYIGMVSEFLFGAFPGDENILSAVLKKDGVEAEISVDK